MAPTKRKYGGSKHKGRSKMFKGSKPKRRKLNLITIRQQQDLRELGDYHPVDAKDSVKNYTKVEDVQDNEKEESDFSSSESEEENPLKVLHKQFGWKEEIPDSEQEEEDSDNDVDENILSGDSVGEEEEEDDDDDTESHVKSSSEDEDPNSGAEETDKFTAEDKQEVQDVVETMEDMTKLEESDSDEDIEIDLPTRDPDPFTKHFEHEMDLTELFEGNMKWLKKDIKNPLGESILMYKDEKYLPKLNSSEDLKMQHVKHKVVGQVSSTNKKFCKLKLKKNQNLTKLQRKLFCQLNSYQDLLYPSESLENMEELRLVYCLHALNHVLKTRSRVTSHNTKLKNKTTADDGEEEVEYRDIGFTRPKVLILLPYRDRALKVLRILISLLSDSNQTSVSNLKRFETEFTELDRPEDGKPGYKPDDFTKMFEGNIDDNFRVSLSVAKKSIRLYSPFYESDIILASPLGLKTVIGEEGDKKRDYDFLSSLEIVILDQTDVFQMQNWEHVLHVFKHLHLQPKESHGVDFSRVRTYFLNGWSKLFRQTIIFSQGLLYDVNNLFFKYCHNFCGKLVVRRQIQSGSIEHCLSDRPQVFHRVYCNSVNTWTQLEAKLDFFKKKILPYHTSAGMKQTLIFCNFNSFVELRNYFRQEDVDYLFISEYDSIRDIRNARIHFRKRHPFFMLYTERLHFHHRFKLRGIHHIVYFDLPQYPTFFPELVNSMDVYHKACTVTTLFTRYDSQKLREIVGDRKADHMLVTEKDTTMISL